MQKPEPTRLGLLSVPCSMSYVLRVADFLAEGLGRVIGEPGRDSPASTTSTIPARRVGKAQEKSPAQDTAHPPLRLYPRC